MKKVNGDKIKEIRRFVFPDAIVTVQIPDLTEEERAKRMKEVHDAAADLLREVYARKKPKTESES